MKTFRVTGLLACMTLLGGCASYAPLPTVSHVDLDRFMGDWYVIASIPTPFEHNIYNAVENYQRIGPKKIQTTFTYRKGGFEGAQKQMRPTGFVTDDPSNAVWGMQFIWPFKSDYRIVHLDPAYSETIIGREKRDYVWIMARQPQLADADYARLVDIVRSIGYDTSQLKKVPQKWETAR
ncbi:MAG: lipocalin family protein [Thiolinea sp.]